MGFRIATNPTSLSAQRQLENTTRNLATTLDKLSSGSRINKAADDSAGLAISEKLKAQIRSLGQAKRNANDGISLVQTAEAAMNEIANSLIRMRELSIQAASDTVGQDERSFINIEIQQIKSEIQRISETTEFNGTPLLKGDEANLSIQIGPHNKEGLDNIVYSGRETGSDLLALGIEEVQTIDRDGSKMNLAQLDNALIKLNGNRARLGALQNRLQSAVTSLNVSTENLSRANSNIRDTDVAGETSELAKQQILSQSGIAVLAQANALPKAALQLLA